ncbi:HEAT repeat domain-containing protein [Streptomyces sp. NPDC051940]|uniref:HEAT repeat domain-containing protein n=1 Tax=Streptomyces sp. NPDC051940 TaxID=3155675 RepID=UPI0034382ECB
MDEREAALDRLAAGLADLDEDVDELIDLADELESVLGAEHAPRVEAHLTAAVRAANTWAREMLGILLAGIGGPAALPALLRAGSVDLGDDQDGLSTRLADLAAEDPARSRGVLLPLLHDPDRRLRAKAVWLLGFVPEPSDLELLARTAQDPDEDVRGASVGTIGSHTANSPAAVDLLLRLLADPAPQVRVSALSSLGYAGQPHALPAIRACADDPDARVRAWTAIALGRFPGAEPETRAVLRRLHRDPDSYVRSNIPEWATRPAR